MTAIVVRRNPSRTLTTRGSTYRPASFLDEIERWVTDTWESWTPAVYDTGLYPRLDVYEEKDELVIRTELPGVSKEDIDVSLEGTYLTIKAEKKPETVSEETTYYSCERCFGTYYRSVSLPFPVDSEKICSTFDKGLLEIRLPKAEEAKPKHIEVKVK
ncbi:MAG: Hsp20/alpha crystallin family protein [Chloroflexi bacterium]|nr:Hsp20/alpha crystallin family protein [Chloroflexota bacterium]